MKALDQMHAYGSTLRVGAGLAVFVALVSVTGAAKAVIAPMDSMSLSAAEFPVGGAITGAYVCYQGCSPQNVMFTDEQGQAIPGSYVTVAANLGSNTFVFVPEPQLAPGNYNVQLASSFSSGTGTFAIVPASDELPTINAVLSALVGGTDQVGCEESSSTGHGGVFFESMQTRAQVNTTTSGLNSTQYAYSLVPEGEAPGTYWSPRSQVIFEGTPAEVCFDLYGQPLLDDTVVLIGSECLSTDGLDLGKKDEISGNPASVLGQCTVPPVDYFDEWCEQFSGAIERQSCELLDPEACFSARRTCPEGDNPSVEQEEEELAAAVGGSGSGGTAAGGTGDPVNGSGNAGSTDVDDESFDEGGCSLRSPKGSGPGHLWLLLGMGLVVGLRRRTGRAPFSRHQEVTQ